jgi:putative membrane protein
MKNIIYRGLLGIAVIFTACNKQQQGEVNDLNDPARDINKTTVDEAKQANKSNEAVKENCSGFVVEAAQHGKMEHELSSVASERAYSKEVKVLAQQLMGDHAKANSELKTIAEKKSIRLATEDEKKAGTAAGKVENEKGEAFDKAYLDLVVTHHRQSVRMYEDAEDCEDAEIKSFVSKNLPVLKKHLETAEMMQEAIKKRSNDGYTKEKAATGPH